MYPMPRFKIFEKLARGANPALFRVLQALTDAFFRVGSGGNIKQSLIGLRVLNDCRGLPLHGEHYRALRLFQLLHEVARPATERC